MLVSEESARYCLELLDYCSSPQSVVASRRTEIRGAVLLRQDRILNHRHSFTLNAWRRGGVHSKNSGCAPQKVLSFARTL